MQANTYIIYTGDNRPMGNYNTRKQAEMRVRELEQTKGLKAFGPFSIKVQTVYF